MLCENNIQNVKMMLHSALSTPTQEEIFQERSASAFQEFSVQKGLTTPSF
jgi:hypothetical protein